MIPIDTRHTGHEKFIKIALWHIPTADRKSLDKNTKIVTMHRRFGYCMKAKIDANIIIINDAILDVILPLDKLTNDQPLYRWLVYAVLHEVAHAFLGHDGEQNDEKEKQAEKQAIDWYNNYAPIKHNLPEMDDKEIEKTEQEVKILLGWQDS